MSSLLPLVCSPFEQYMLFDDRPDYPATGIMEFEVSGPIDPERLRQAFTDILPRHPLLTAQLESRPFQRPRWIPSTIQPEFNIGPSGADHGPVASEFLDLSRGPGTRVVVRATADQATLALHVHHACSDAVGKLGVFADWLSRYAVLSGDQRYQTLPDPHLERLPIRGRPRPAARPFKGSSRWRDTLRETKKFFRLRPDPMVTSDLPSHQESVGSPAFVTVSFTSEETSRIRGGIRAAGRQEQLTLNDALLVAMLVSLGRWSEQHSERGDPLFRLLVPFNMRLDEELFDSACNRIGYRFLMHQRSEVRDLVELSRAVYQRMERTRAQRTSDFVRFLSILGSNPLLASLLRRRVECPTTVFATAVLSNLGEVSRMFQHRFPIMDGCWQVGPLRVDAIRACPPKRPMTRMCIVAQGYAQKLSFTSRADGRGMAPEQTLAFLELFRQTVLDIADIAVPVA